MTLAPLLLILALAGPGSAQPAPPAAPAALTTKKARVHDVVDGDSVYVLFEGGQRPEVVRLLGIQAPRDSGNDTPEDLRALASRKALQRLVLKKDVRLQIQADRPRDRFGRVLAYLFVDPALDVNAMMLKTGHAVHYTRAPHPRAEEFARLEAEAAGRPVGSVALPASGPAPARPREPLAVGVPPKDAPAFFVTKTGRIHRGTCTVQSVIDELKGGRVEKFDSIEKARAWGMHPCKVCKPE